MSDFSNLDSSADTLSKSIAAILSTKCVLCVCSSRAEALRIPGPKSLIYEVPSESAVAVVSCSTPCSIVVSILEIDSDTPCSSERVVPTATTPPVAKIVGVYGVSADANAAMVVTMAPTRGECVRSFSTVFDFFSDAGARRVAPLAPLR